VIAAVVLSGVCLALALTVIPGVLVRHDLHGRPISTQEYLKAVADARTLILQTVGGVAVAIGAYATWRRLRISEDELHATRDGQVTERFTRAIEQLGSANLDVRTGAIFALARIADNSPTDRDAVIATLSAFARSHSPWSREHAEAADSTLPADLPTLATRASDVQSAISVLGRLPRTAVTEWIRLPSTDLRRARMWQLNLDRGLFGSSNLRGARLWDSSLVGADLGFADLRDTDLAGADLSHAILWGTDLRGARLTGARLQGAEADAKTKWPDGFDFAAHGVILTKQDATHERRRPG